MAQSRPMWPMNKVYWYFDRMVNANSCEWLEIKGRLNVGVLRDAALAVAARHPVLNARLAPGLRQGYRWFDDAADKPIDIRHERVATHSIEDIHDRLVRNIWEERLPLTRGRPLRLHVTELEETTVLQVITTHVFTDGRSANVVIRDLVRAYNALIVGQSWHPSPVDVDSRDPVALFTGHLSAIDRLRLTLKAVRMIVSELFGPAGRIAAGKRKRGSTDIILVDLGVELFQQVREASQSTDVSRHPFYVVAAVRAIEEFNARRGVRSRSRIFKIVDNFSLRRFARQDVEDLYDLCSIPYSLKADGALSDLELIQDVFGQIERLRSGEILAEVFRQQLYDMSAKFSPKLIATKMVTKHIVKSNFILSNIGPVPDDIDHFGPSPVHAYFSFSQLFPPGQVMFLLSTKSDALRLVCLFDSANFGREEVQEELVGNFCRHLRRLASTFGPSPESRSQVAGTATPAFVVGDDSSKVAVGASAGSFALKLSVTR